MEGLTVNVNVNINSEGDARSMEQAIFQYAMPALKDLRQKEKDKIITQEEAKFHISFFCLTSVFAYILFVTRLTWIDHGSSPFLF